MLDPMSLAAGMLLGSNKGGGGGSQDLAVWNVGLFGENASGDPMPSQASVTVSINGFNGK